MKFYQYLPAYYDDSIERFELEFENKEDLLNLEVFISWKKHPEFFRFSQDRTPIRTYLMGEKNKGYHWFVLGFVDGKIDLGLPDWEAKFR